MIDPIDIVNRVNEAHEGLTRKVRYHMGASGVGELCERKLWLQFRWALEEQFPGRILRLFRRGQNEEATVVSDLQAIGFKVTDTEEDQLFIDLGSHVGGSTDGVLEWFEEGVKHRAVLEIKTHSRKSYDKLVREGVQISKPLHYFQMQSYMLGMAIDVSLYYAICKDTDRIHTQWIEFNPEAAEAKVERAQRIATQDELPAPLTDNPSWYECKFCNFHGFCHKDEKIEAKHCRTCAYSSALEDGTWFCEKHKGEIEQKWQTEGCKYFEMHDHLVKE